MAGNIENRIIKLEARRGAKRTFVIRMSDPMTKEELALLAAAKAEGRKFAIVPHKATCSSEEWAARAAAAAAKRNLRETRQ